MLELYYVLVKNKDFSLKKKVAGCNVPPPESDAPQRESAGHGMPSRGLQKAVGPDTCAVMLAQP